MSRLTERTRYGIVGNNDRVINYPLYKIADADPLDRRIVGQCFEKLADYEDAEEQGLLLRLPCKVGDTIYLVDFEENDYDEAIIEEIIIGKNGIFINSDYEIGTPLNADYVTLTEEEAEKKLAEMKGE